MKVTVNHGEGLACELIISLPTETIEPKIEQRLVEAAKQVRVDGFRPGKVPMRLVKDRFGKAVRAEIVSEQIESAYFKAVEQEKIQPAGFPEIEVTQDKAGKDLEFKATVELFPEVEVKNADKIEIERPVAEVTDADFDDMLETLQKQHTDWKAVDRKAKNEDRVTIDFEGFIDDEAFEGGKGADMPVVLGSNSMIPGFEEGLVGAKADDHVTLNVNFPDNYHADNLAGKAARFEVDVKKVEAPELPKLDKAFAEKFNVDSIAKFKKDVRSNMERELSFAIKGRIKSQLIDELIKHNEIAVPSALTQQEIGSLKQDALQRMGGGVDKQKLPELPDELFKEQAERRVKLGLLMGSVIKANKLEPDEKRVDEMLKTMTSVYEDTDEAIAQFKQDQQRMNEIRQAVLEDQVVDKLLESAKVTDKPMKFTEIMGN